MWYLCLVWYVILTYLLFISAYVWCSGYNGDHFVPLKPRVTGHKHNIKKNNLLSISDAVSTFVRQHLYNNLVSIQSKFNVPQLSMALSMRRRESGRLPSQRKCMWSPVYYQRLYSRGEVWFAEVFKNFLFICIDESELKRNLRWSRKTQWIKKLYPWYTYTTLFLSTVLRLCCLIAGQIGTPTGYSLPFLLEGSVIVVVQWR